MPKLKKPFLAAIDTIKDFTPTSAPFHGLTQNEIHRLRYTHSSYANIIHTILYTQYDAKDLNVLFWPITPQRTMIQLRSPKNFDGAKGVQKFISDLMRARMDCYGESHDGILFKQGKIEQGNIILGELREVLISFDVEAIASPLKAICNNTHLLQRIEILEAECAQNLQPKAFRYIN